MLFFNSCINYSKSALKYMVLLTLGIEFKVRASCESRDLTIHSATTTVTIKPTDTDNNRQSGILLSDDAIEQACFEGVLSTLTVEENRASTVLGILRGCSSADGLSRRYKVKRK